MPRRDNAGTHVRARRRVLAQASVLGIAALATPAAALAVVNEPPALPHSIISFPQRDFVSAAGFDASDSVVVNVLRNNVTIGTSTPITPVDDGDPTTPFTGLAEVNHPGGGCWLGTTPDILPGDVVRTTVVGPGLQDQTTTANVTADSPTNPAPGTIVITGTAQDAAGNPLPAAQIEERLVSGGNLFDRNGKRTLRASAAGADGTLAYDAAGSVHWTATYTELTDADVARALSAESRALWLGANPGTGQELTIYENPGTPGPAPPCTAPLAVNGVTSTDHTFNGKATVNNDNAGTDVQLSGLAQADVTDVSVQIADAGAGTTTTVAGDLTSGPNGKTWTASVPSADVAALADGTLTAAATFTTPSGPIGGSMLTLTKDTAAPAAPTAAPGAGTYPTAQAVALAGADHTATIHYTLDGSDPGFFTAAASGQILITSSLTLRAVAVDPAGNASAIKDFAFVIAPPTAPPPPPPPPPVVAPPVGTSTTTAGGGSTTPAGATATAGTTTGAEAAVAVAGSARPALVLKSLGVAPRIKQSKARKSGLRLVMRLPGGTEVVKINVYRRTSKGLQLLSSGLKAPSSAAGVYRVAQDHAALRRLLTKGSYEVQVTPGYSRSELGKTTKAGFKVV